MTKKSLYFFCILILIIHFVLILLFPPNTPKPTILQRQGVGGYTQQRHTMPGGKPERWDRYTPGDLVIFAGKGGRIKCGLMLARNSSQVCCLSFSPFLSLFSCQKRHCRLSSLGTTRIFSSRTLMHLSECAEGCPLCGVYAAPYATLSSDFRDRRKTRSLLLKTCCLRYSQTSPPWCFSSSQKSICNDGRNVLHVSSGASRDYQISISFPIST